MDKVQAAAELRRAMQFFVRTLSEESDILEVSSIYPDYTVGKAYKTKDVFKYGLNAVGDPQLYQVLMDHTSSEEWTPDTATSLYKPIGVSQDGIPHWVQPLCSSDAYNAGDVVIYKDDKYESLIDGNVWAPDAYPDGWKKLED